MKLTGKRKKSKCTGVSRVCITLVTWMERRESNRSMKKRFTCSLIFVGDIFILYIVRKKRLHVHVGGRDEVEVYKLL